MENQPLLLAELEDLSSIFTPLKTTSRIKYTCFNVSNNFLIFGASSGGLYVFCRTPCCFLQLLPNKEGSVTQVAISPDEKLIAFATIKGIVCILEKTSHSAKQWVTTLEHQNEQITCLQWNEGSNELFVGDSSGKVSIVTVSAFPTKSMFQNPSFVLMQLDSKIVQMDFSSNMLLVSTLTKCYICDTTKEVFRQVGHKLRDGEYGACIFNTQVNHDASSDVKINADSEKNSEYSNLSHLKLLCARPGSRVWEVAIDGTVISTHHFKEALAIPPHKVYFLNNSTCQNINLCNSGVISNGDCEQISTNYHEQSFNFQKLHIILSKFCLTYKSDGIYIFDPEKATVVLWSNDIMNIVDVKCLNDVIYVWSNYGKLYALNLIPLEKFLVHLYFQKKYVELGKICLEFESFLLNQANNCSKLHILHDLGEKLKSDELWEQLKPLIDMCKENAQKRKIQSAQKLKSNMCDMSDKDQLLFKRGVNGKLLRPSYLHLKNRSHSVSPERLQNGDLKHQGSSSSLPDLIKDGTVEESFTEGVVNEKKHREKQQTTQEVVHADGVSLALADVKNAVKPSNDLIFILFDKILGWCSFNEADENKNFESIHPLPLDTYFNADDFKLISELFHSALKSKLLFEWLDKFNGDWLEKAVIIYPEFLIKHYPVESLYLDYKLSKIIKLFSVALKENEIIESIRELEMQCYYFSLNEVLNIYHDPSVFSVPSLNLGNITSIPKLLNVAYFLITVGQIEQCSKYSHKINLNDVFYLILKFEESSTRTNSSELIELQCHTLFLSYLDKSCRERELITGCSNVIESYIINCLENIINAASCVKEPNCSCGFPYPGLQPSITMFPKVGNALLDKNWPKDLAKCMEICGKVPYLWKHFVCIRRNEPICNLLPLLLHLGDLQEFENRSADVDANILEISLRHLVSLRNGNCLNCNEKIKSSESSGIFTEFGMLCVKLLGPKETLELYSKYPGQINSKELDQTFYQSLIFSSIMEKHIKGLRKNVVDLLAGKGGEEPYRVPVFSEKLHHKVLFDRNSQSSSESTFHHWSVKVNFKKNCSVCSLPLDTKVLISEAGLVVFKCAHAFHSACLRRVDLECPVCKSKSSETSKM